MDAEDARDFFHIHPGEEAQLGDLTRARVVLREAGESLLQRQDVSRDAMRERGILLKRHVNRSSAALLRRRLAGVVDKNTPHLTCGDRTKVCLSVLVNAIEVDEPDVCLVNEIGRLKTVSGPLTAKTPSGDSKKLVVDEGLQSGPGHGISPRVSLDRCRHVAR